jgi:hypothetical protein
LAAVERAGDASSRPQPCSIEGVKGRFEMVDRMEKAAKPEQRAKFAGISDEEISDEVMVRVLQHDRRDNSSPADSLQKSYADAIKPEQRAKFTLLGTRELWAEAQLRNLEIDIQDRDEKFALLSYSRFDGVIQIGNGESAVVQIAGFGGNAEIRISGPAIFVKL